MSRWPQGAAGLTLVELLVASALFLTLLTAFAALLAQARSADRTREAEQVAVIDREAIRHLLSYELSLAGYGGLGDASLLQASDPTLTVDFTEDVHALSIRYVEDQFVANGPEIRTARLWVDPTAAQLLRAVDGAEAAVMADGITALRLDGYLRRDFGVVTAFDQVACGGPCSPPEFIAGVALTLDFSDGEALALTVGFHNLQRVVVLP